MTPNYYAILGLSPTSEDVVIRAAYLALMRRYHPDRNPYPEAAARTRAIAAAYAVLGDAEKRAEFDHLRAEGMWAMAPPPRAARRPGRSFAAASTTLLLVLVLLVVWSPLPLAEPERPARGQDRVVDGDRTVTPPAPELQLTARELAQENSPPEPEPELEPVMALGAPDFEPAPEPAPKSAGAPAPRLAAAAPRLAATAPPAPRARPASRPQARQPTASQPPASQAAVSQAAVSRATPSFSCLVARTRGEIAVCNSANLASLDRQQALLFNQSWGQADAAERALLLRTRERFIARRDSCRSSACTTGAYLARMREVSGIMTGEDPPAR